MKAEAGRR